MPKTSVYEPLFDDGLQSINFFNGRLLSAEDLKTEKKATREERRRLGIALGEGIVRGLEVRAGTGGSDNATVTVTAGLAIARSGDTIALSSTTDVSLLVSRQPPAGTTQIVQPFDYCTPPSTDLYRSGAAVYLLAIRKAHGGKGRAPVSGLGNESASCNVRYLVEGVQFVLVRVPVDALLGNVATLRNRLAHACFGTSADAARTTDLLGAPVGSDIVSALRDSGGLSDCDVPLAVLYWTGGGTQFVDMWAVRRRVAAASADPLGHILDATVARRAEARLLQFQAQLAAILLASTSVSTLEARTNFVLLPPVAFLPITGVRRDGSTLRPATGPSARRALDYERFFGDRMKAPPRVVEGARIGPLLKESLTCPPIDLTGDQMFWLFAVRENMQAVERGEDVAPYLVVASPHLRYQADARFDVSQWDYANFV
jgi:hypothetical protein